MLIYVYLIPLQALIGIAIHANRHLYGCNLVVSTLTPAVFPLSFVPISDANIMSDAAPELSF